MARTWAAVGVAGIVLAGHAVPAAAAPRPLAPEDGSRVTSSLPLFRWALPPGESALAISIARLPVTNAEGTFLERHVVVTEALAANAERWMPRRPLWAGGYWWLVSSVDEEGATIQSRVSGFTIPISLKVIRLTQPAKRVLSVRWRGNVRNVSILVRMTQRGRLLWTGRARGTARAPGRPMSTRFRIPERYTPALQRGASFTVRISARLAPQR